MSADFVQLFLATPVWYQYFLVVFLGAIMASFANVVAYRLHTNATLGGRSRCFSCGHTLRWFELVPIVSYLSLGGRCRACRVRIPRRDLWVELLTAGLFLSAYILAPSVGMMLLWWLLVVLLLIVTVYDLEHFIIPNELVGMVALVSVGVFLGTAWPLTMSAVYTGALSVITAAGLYAALWSYSNGSWLGFGDVKLAAALGLFLTIEQAFSMVVLSFWIGATVGVVVVYGPYWWRRAYSRSRSTSPTTLKSEIPFAPFITAAFLVVYMYGINVFSFFTIW